MLIYFDFFQYIFSLVVLLVAECVLTLFAIICPQYLGLAIDKDDLVTLWQRNYGVPGKEQMTVAIDLIQTKFECCGALSGTEYSISWWNLKELAAPNLLVPFSCCVQGENKSYLDPSPLNNTLCQEKEMDNYRLARHVEVRYLTL
ncbi:hypothetical protein AAG570_012810 [Ranatra chinensis]|uniref:Uncharacterized protein n=1 Tax=Ranatra chinensis TaxID=642074 RepID=A0ABD0YEX9_9HEMI